MCASFAEVLVARTLLADVKVTDRMIGMSRRCQRVRSHRQLAIDLIDLVHEQVYLLNHAANARSQNYRVAEVTTLAIHCFVKSLIWALGVAAYGIGASTAFWTIERLVSFWSCKAQSGQTGVTTIDL